MNISTFCFNKKQLFSLTIALFSFITSGHAVSLSTQKIHLDQKNRNYNFIVYNKGEFEQKCELYLKPITFNKYNVSRILTNGEQPENSADSMLVFSPKQFTLGIGKPQSIKFKLRMKRNTKAQEYRSYIAIECEEINTEKQTTNDSEMNVSPKLIHNIPIVARIGSPKYKLSFSNPNFSDNKLTVTLNKTGIYSTYGKLTLIDKKSKKTIGQIKEMKMPIEAENKVLSIPLKEDYQHSALQLIYLESNQYMQPKKVTFDIN
jgi:P pilus assembly chaperone PapD